MWIVGLAASNGGNWSRGVSYFRHEKNTTEQVNFIFGLTTYRFDAGDYTFEQTYSYMKKNAAELNLLIDFDDIEKAGRGTEAFLALGIVLQTFSVLIHLLIWPLKKLRFIH